MYQRTALVVLITTVIAGCDWSLPREPEVIYVVGPDYHGWICVDYEVKGAPPLPREGKAVVVRPGRDDIIQAADKVPGFLFSETWVEDGQGRRSRPANPGTGHTLATTGPNELHQRVCHFVGTIDQHDAAANPPGFNTGMFADRPVSEVERAALIALYEATGGPSWTHNVGWLGAPGTECKWHGVDCDTDSDRPTTWVTGLDLYSNNLRGALPSSLGAFAHLESIGLPDEVTGQLPTPLIRRWLAGDLEVLGGTSLLTDITEAVIEYNAPSACANYRVVLRADGTASRFNARCRFFLPFPGGTECEVKHGGVYVQDFARLAHIIEQSSYFSLKPEYSRSVTHSAFEITHVTRGGKTHRVSDYASAGPQELWTIRRAISGVANGVHWQETKIQLGVSVMRRAPTQRSAQYSIFE
jgi:hypothetical protein